MQYLLAFAVAILLVVGQALWKIGIMQVGLADGLAAKKLVALALNPAILTGCIIYLVATVLYMYTIGRFAYGTSYAMIVSFSLILASIMAMGVFRERLSPLNLFGVLIILLGVTLVLWRR